MSQILSIVLILLGIAEIMIAVMDIKMPVIVGVVLGIMFVALGIRALLDAGKKKRD